MDYTIEEIYALVGKEDKIAGNKYEYTSGSTQLLGQFITVPEGYSLNVFASGGDRVGGMKKSYELLVTSNLPEDIFYSWDEVKISGGTEEWGDFAVLNITKGNIKSKTITIQIEGSAGNYGQNMMNYNATFYPILRAVSRSIIIKIHKSNWKEAIWDYELLSGESIQKSLEKAWAGRIGKLYRKYK